MREILQVQGLTKTYPGFRLEEVSFSLEKGKIHGFIGRNGAGKSTTLKALLDFVHPDSGEIRFWGQDFSGHQAEIKERIGFVTGGVSFYPRKKLKLITAVTRGFYANWDERAYEDYCRRFKLDENKTPGQLSAGMQVKYALALALSHRAELLILDEPTSGLDPVSREELLDELLGLAEEGVTILFSTHITSDLDRCADRILYIREGKLRADQPLEEFRDQYRLVKVKKADLTEERKKTLVGIRRSREGYTALLPAGEPVPDWLTAEKATLEDIMVHLEKEDEE